MKETNNVSHKHREKRWVSKQLHWSVGLDCFEEKKSSLFKLFDPGCVLALNTYSIELFYELNQKQYIIKNRCSTGDTSVSRCTLRDSLPHISLGWVADWLADWSQSHKSSARRLTSENWIFREQKDAFICKQMCMGKQPLKPLLADTPFSTVMLEEKNPLLLTIGKPLRSEKWICMDNNIDATLNIHTYHHKGANIRLSMTGQAFNLLFFSEKWPACFYAEQDLSP